MIPRTSHTQCTATTYPHCVVDCFVQVAALFQGLEVVMIDFTAANFYYASKTLLLVVLVIKLLFQIIPGIEVAMELWMSLLDRLLRNTIELS